MWNELLHRMPESIAQLAMERWGGQKLCLVSCGINRVYSFERDQRCYYLRISHCQLRSEAAMLAAIHYQQHLYQTGVTVCQPIMSKHGLWVESMNQGADVFLASVCLGVAGKSMRFDHTDVASYEQWGRTLGQLHNAAQDYDATMHSYATWQQSLVELQGYAKHEAVAIQYVLQTVTDFFENRLHTTIDYGLTHGDHRKGNVLFDGKHVTIIDFDLPCWHWFSEDVFRPFFSTIMKDQLCWQNKWRPYIEGYLSVRPKNCLDLDSFVKHLQLKALEIYLWTKNNWSDATAPGGIDTKTWLTMIQHKLEDLSWIDNLVDLL